MVTGLASRRGQIVSAHAVFISALPAPGAVLAEPPPVVRIVFSEPLNAGGSGIELLESSGAMVRSSAAGVAPSNAAAYKIELPRLAPDRYTVAWHSVSLVD